MRPRDALVTEIYGPIKSSSGHTRPAIPLSLHSRSDSKRFVYRAVTDDHDRMVSSPPSAQLRQRALLSQCEVERLTGISDATIAYLESGRHRPQSETLRKLLLSDSLCESRVEAPTLPSILALLRTGRKSSFALFSTGRRCPVAGPGRCYRPAGVALALCSFIRNGRNNAVFIRG
jgi:DNA-binding transcriptional regulator YiaG